jgi:hypothetical protein
MTTWQRHGSGGEGDDGGGDGGDDSERTANV